MVDGRYRVEGVIGEGGMGIVVAARHVGFGHRVAIKYLRPTPFQREDVRARFRWEGRATSRLRSEHVVRVTDAGTLGDGTPYIAMELLEGVDLGVLLRRQGPLGTEEAVDYILQACKAIGESHALGIVHRDLKPANLFVTRRADGSALVKVIDFGLSSGVDFGRNTYASDGRPTNVELMGSPAYMAPEQIRNFEAVDARADVWSLGAILYELLTGSLIHDDTSLGPLLARICHCDVKSARRHRPDLPEELDSIVLRCLERSPEKRFQSASDLAQALFPFAAQYWRTSGASIQVGLAGALAA